METIKVRATLQLASKEDIFCGQNIYSGLTLFLKNPYSLEFSGLWKIPDLYNESNLLNECTINEIYAGLHHKQFYKLSQTHNSLDFQFKLILKKADWFDFFESERYLKKNIIYYKMSSATEVTGPLKTDSSSEILTFKNAVEKGIIYVLSNNQTFEPIKTAQAS